jgi:hypothetical protein
MIMTLKIAVAAIVIAFTSWLSGKKPELAGFIIAMPIASLLALAFAQAEHGNHASSITFAKSILIGVPASWLFFLPFFFSHLLGDNFWLCYGVGFALLIVGYGLHSLVLLWF